ncbi:MAG: hypothetical protein IGR92_16410 [Leptolyngbyaceae cyanobacterium T60_A2020_046]|nr:hypothetical protein [Leptolyngbyaceae cyanobacterium T60_A2020_046]
METLLPSLVSALHGHHQRLTESLSRIDWPRHRAWYGQVVLNRLMVLHLMQTAGFLGQGDRWYLHNQQQQHAGSFHAKVLLPLCHGGLSCPEGDRDANFRQRFGAVPYLGCRLFRPHPLERRYPDLHLEDEPLEALLAWFAETTWQLTDTTPPHPAGITLPVLAAALEAQYAPWDRAAILEQADRSLRELCDRTLTPHILTQIHTVTGRSFPSMSALFAALDDALCVALVTQILPATTVLDPACGTGRWLMQMLADLFEIYGACVAHAQRSRHPALRAWLRSRQSEAPNLAWSLKAHLLIHTLYGVDASPEAVEIAQMQGVLALLATVTQAADIVPLPPLEFNLLAGNALVGLIRVDEASFDQVGSRGTKATAPKADATALQGNLLQPLAAQTYQTTLAEKQIRIEHYRSQMRAIAAEALVPPEAQMALLRDRIETLNHTAQHKLNQLLFNEFSLTLGIRAQEPQPTGRARTRLLTLADIEALQPFHWGFYFHRVFDEAGGFAIVGTRAPQGTLGPNLETFYNTYVTIFERHGISLAMFKKSRKAALGQSPELAAAWGHYAAQFAYLKTYFCRSDAYRAIAQTGRSLPWSALYAQRCQHLTRPNGIACIAELEPDTKPPRWHIRPILPASGRTAKS